MAKNSEALWTADVSEVLRVGEGFRLADVDPESQPGFVGDKTQAEDALAQASGELSQLQEKFFARSHTGGDPRSILLVLQAMDTAGKGGIVRHVVGSVDPQGVRLAAFKAPTAEEGKHDFLWRVEKRVPDAGMIGVFDRSHYEDVLIGRVRELASTEEIQRRYGAIVDFERRLAASNTVIIKVMLQISADEQKARLQERLERPDKHWKFNPGDIDERMLWPAYQQAYQTVFERTATPEAPWFVVPANKKWYARLAVQQLLLGALRDMKLEWPAADFDVEAEKKRLAAS